MVRSILLTAAIMGGLAVAIGAFGAHALAPILEANGRTATFGTASDYHFYHAIVLLFLGLLTIQVRLPYLRWIFGFYLGGMVIFSGTLYALCITNFTFLGAITPLGGLSLILGWGLLGVGIFRTNWSS